jgi:hypothetical protein
LPTSADEMVGNEMSFRLLGKRQEKSHER